jgi:acetyl esterase
MPLDRDAADLLDTLAAIGAPALSDGTIDEARANYEAAPRPEGDPVERIEDRFVPGPGGDIAVRLYASSQASELPVLMFFHGGGWVLSSVDGHDHMARRLAARTGALIASVEYRLAPEHPFPAPHDDCWAATAWAVAHAAEWGGDPARIAVCGDSAGANLAAGVALRARDEGVELALQALIYPCIDDRQAVYPSMRENADGYFLTAADMVWFWDHFVPPQYRDDPRAVPARATDLSGSAPALVITAEFDPLRDEGEQYGRRLLEAGVPTTITRYPGVVHGFVTRWAAIARAEHAHDEIAAVIQATLRGLNGATRRTRRDGARGP